MKRKVITLHSLEDTRTFGERLGALLQEPVCLLLEGDMGAGKTQMAKAIAKGLGVLETVTSPTFSLMNTYDSGRITLHHFDLYRLEDVEELFCIGFSDYVEHGVSIVEWADSFPELMPEVCIRMQFQLGDEETRVLTVEGYAVSERIWTCVEEACRAISN